MNADAAVSPTSFFDVREFSGSDLCCIRGERLVFRNLDFSLRSGEALILAGPNGSGKSSLLRLMAGLLAPAKGKLDWTGMESGDLPLHYIAHADGVKPALSVRDYLCFWTRMRNGDPGRIEEALHAFGLERLHDTPGRFLSAGQKRRLALCRLLTVDAPLWLLDEPSVGLDARSTAALEQVIATHRRHGGMAVVATHTPLALPDHRRLKLGSGNFGTEKRGAGERGETP